MWVSTLPNINFTASPVPPVYSSVTLFCFLNARGCEHHLEPSHRLWSVAPAVELSVKVLLTLVAGYTERRNSFHAGLTFSFCRHFPPSLWIESQHREPELPPCSDFLHSNGTGEEHFLQTQGAGWCREKGGGWKSCVHMCMTLWDTTGCRSQPALLSEPALTLQGTMLTAGRKRFLASVGRSENKSNSSSAETDRRAEM